MSKATSGGARLAPRETVDVSALGVKATVRVDCMDDYDLVLTVTEKGASSFEAMVAVIGAMFGDDWERISSELRDDGGKLSMSRVSEFVNACIEQVGELKN